MPKKGLNVSLQSYDDIFSTEDSRQKSSYILLIDVCKFIPFNEDYRLRIGDLALIEAMKRIGNHTTEDMNLMTLAGDEWILFSNKSSIDEARAIANEIFKYNGNTVGIGEVQAPLFLRIEIINSDLIDDYNSIFAARELDAYMDKLKMCSEYLMEI